MAGEEIDKHVLRKYDVQQKLGKGVRTRRGAPVPVQPSKGPGLAGASLARR